MARAENHAELSGWKRKRGYWCCPEHIRAEQPLAQLQVVGNEESDESELPEELT